MSFFTTAVRYIISDAVALFWGLLFIFRLIISTLWSPFSPPWRYKKREDYPEILNDPKYGSHNFMKVNNISIHYVEKGDNTKPLMLFIHGFPDFWFTWRHQMKHFSSDYWTVAIDMRGYGESEKPRGIAPYEMNNLVDDVKEFVKGLGRDKFILVAHDWGGVVSHSFIRKYPEMLERYILMNTAYSRAWKGAITWNFGQFLKSWYFFFFQIPELPELSVRMGDYSVFNYLYSKYATTEEIEAYKYVFRNKGYVTSAINYYRALFSNDSPRLDHSNLNNLKVPGLYIHGLYDRYLTLGTSMKRSFDNIDNVRTIILPAGHFVHLSSYKQVNESMEHFLNMKN